MDESTALQQVYELPCCAGEECVTLALFRGVSNAPRLRSQVTSGKIKAALLDPTLLASPFHVLAAVNKAVVSRDQQQMKTKNVFSEVIFSLSPSTNISDSFKKFGIRDSSQSVLAVLLHPPGDTSQWESLCGSVEGELVTLEQLAEEHDQAEIKKLYKIPSEECAISSLENSVVTRMVTKDVT